MLTDGSLTDRRKLLVVEDDEDLVRQLRWQLQDYDLLLARQRSEALSLLCQHEPDVVLLDLGLPPEPSGVREGLATLEGMLGLKPMTKVIVLTGQDARAHALEAVGGGAYDFHTKPISPEVLELLLGRAFYLAGLEQENQRLLSGGSALPGVVGDSPAVQKVGRMVERLGPTGVSVVILGESGTGKEVVARALHASGPRREGRFVAINCAAIPDTLLEAELFGFERGAFTGAVKQTPGKIELADGGTLFLDEIGDLPSGLQAKLLRFVQERVIERLGGRNEIAVDIRLLSATHRDLRRLVAEGHFREDLYYRLAEVTIALPPLRERPGDAVLLAQHLLKEYAGQLARRVSGFTAEALRAIEAHAWPGNIRELQNRIKRAVILSDGRRIGVDDLDLAPSPAEPADLTLRHARERAELEALHRVLMQTEGNISRAAELLGISRPTLYDLLRHHRLRE